jgi:putative inorganic carbon (HCO3(-)) transporter
MGVAILLAYIALNLLSPDDMLPGLKAFRPALVLALACFLMAILKLSQRPNFKLRTQFVLVILFYGWALFSRFLNGELGANVRTLLELSPNVMVYFMGLFLLNSPRKLNALRTTLLIVAIFVLINAFIGIPSARDLGVTTPYDLTSPIGGFPPYSVRIRGMGMLNDPNVLGHFLLIVLPMLYVRRKDSGPDFPYVIVVPITILFLIGVYWTGSRGAEIGVAAVLGQALIRRFKTTGALLSGTIVALLLLAINSFNGNRTVTVSGGLDRLAIWSDGLSYFKGSPIWGIGYDNFAAKQGMTAHNSYLLCATELGLVGFFLWMSVIVVTFIQLNGVHKLLAKSNPGLARWAAALRLSLGAYLFTGFFLSLTYELLLFMLLGMAGSIITLAGGDDAVRLRDTKWPLWAVGNCAGLLVIIYGAVRLRAL